MTIGCFLLFILVAVDLDLCFGDGSELWLIPIVVVEELVQTMVGNHV